ncbi:hypothetical protein OKW38_007824 [Paraburkholderia sp. MM5496-R1]
MHAQRRAALRKNSPRAVGGGDGAHDIGKRRERGPARADDGFCPSDIAPLKRTTSARPANFHTTATTDAATSAATPSAAAKPAAKLHFARAAQRALLAGRGEVGRIEIGYVASAAYAGVLQKVVGGFRGTHAGVEVSIREVPMDAVAAMLGDGLLDAAYVRPPMPLATGIQATTVHRDRFVLALPADSPLADSASVRPSQLSARPRARRQGVPALRARW